MHRSLASEFLLLLQLLNCSKEEVKMADNYFSILRNHPLETWFDQGNELGGGQAFTVGSEGHERNKKHIVSVTPFVQSNRYNRSLGQGGVLPGQYFRRRRWLRVPNSLD